MCGGGGITESASEKLAAPTDPPFRTASISVNFIPVETDMATSVGVEGIEVVGWGRDTELVALRR
jgi:hypothetical protein